MAEEKEGVKGTVAGWIKGILSSVAGLVSGAVLMYLTPVVNNAIKPAKPVANFAAQVVGMNVTFNNRSTGAVEGWWDFGDGSALEPFDPKAGTIIHPYKKPGTYSVKLSLQNLIGEPSDRSAPVTIDGDGAPKLDFESFELKPLTPGEQAPALYRLQGKVSGATHCILCTGDSKPLEIIEGPATIDRLISYEEMGMYTLRLAAVNGKQLIEKNKEVYVGGGPSGELTAKLKLTYEAVRVERLAKTWRVHCGWQADLKDTVSPFHKERLADPGCTITSVEIVNRNDANAPRKLECKLSPDKTRIILTGELSRLTGVLAPAQTAPSWLAEVKGTLERRSPTQFINRGDVTMAVNPGRPTKIPVLPLGDGWEVVSTQATVELWEGGKRIWSGEPPVANATGMIQNQKCSVSAVKQSDGVLLTIVAPNVPAVPVALPKPVPFVQPTLAPAQPVGPTIRRMGFEFDPRRPLAPPR